MRLLTKLPRPSTTHKRAPTRPPQGRRRLARASAIPGGCSAGTGVGAMWANSPSLLLLRRSIASVVSDGRARIGAVLQYGRNSERAGPAGARNERSDPGARCRS